tara:strand:+ start:10483 stop:10905 length:423 start_codon:yes stop_codon:yes gene_type:complete
LNKILFLVCLVWPGNASASEGKFTLVPQGGIVPFEATCFDTQATAKLLTWKEYLEQELNQKCLYEKRSMSLDYKLVIKNIEITLNETEARYQIEIETRDGELQELRNIIKKNRRLNIPAIMITSVAVGVAVGVGATYVIN